MATLATIITGTILATGKTFTHGLGTTPDHISVINSALATTNPLFVSTYDSQTFVVGGSADSAGFRALVIKLHSLIA